MAKVLQIIKQAMALVSALDSEQGPSATEAQDCLNTLNDMLADWSTSSLLQFSPTQYSYTLPSSVTSFTVGPGGDVDTVRPTAIDNIFVRVGTVDYPIDPISNDEYQSIPMKGLTTGYPTLCWYDPQLDIGVVNLWPGPSAGQSIYFTADQPLQTFASVTDDIDIPANYRRAIAYNLAVEIAPQFGVEASPTVQRIAAASKRSVKRLNTRAAKMRSEAAYLASNITRRGYIISGQS